MKVLILCSILIAVHGAGHLAAPIPIALAAPVPVAAVHAPAPVAVVAHPVAVEEGVSTQVRHQDDIGNYNFAYQEDHTSGGSFRKEAGDPFGNVAGSYGLRVADGRVRVVNYIANDDGFFADVKSNEPGVAPEDPAAVSINKEVVITAPVAPPPVAVAPAPVLASVPLHAPAPAFVAPAAPVSHVSVQQFQVHAPTAVKVPVAPLAAPLPAAPVVDVVKPVHLFPEPAVVAAKSFVALPHAPVDVVQSHVTEVRPVHLFPEPAAVVAKSPVAPHLSAAVVTKTNYAFPYPAAVVPKSPVALAPALHSHSSGHVVANHPFGGYSYGYDYGTHA